MRVIIMIAEKNSYLNKILPMRVSNNFRILLTISDDEETVVKGSTFSCRISNAIFRRGNFNDREKRKAFPSLQNLTMVTH